MSKKEKKLVPKLRFPEFYSNSDWTEKSLGEVTYPVSERNKDGMKLPIYSINNVEGFLPQSDQFDGVDSHSRGYDVSPYKLIEKNTFAYNPARINIGSIGFSGNLHNIIISSLYVCFKTNDELDDSFLFYFLKSEIFNEYVKRNVEGGIRSYLFYENFAKINIQFPLKAEQQKIADCLSSLDELMAAQGSKLEALKSHKKGLMQALIPAKGETIPKLRFPEFKASGGWEEKTLEDVCQMQAGKFVSASEIKEITNDGFLFPCYGGNGLRGYTKSFTHNGKYPLIGRQGALCGNVTLAEGKFHATEHAVVAKPKEKINTIWLFYILTHLKLNQYATGQAQPGLSVENLQKIKVKVPKSEDEQQKIADTFSSLDALITAHTEKLEALKLHKKGLMQGLFPYINKAKS